MNEHEICHTLDTIRDVFNDVNNHRVLDLAPLWARPRCGKLRGVADYYQFYFDIQLGHISKQLLRMLKMLTRLGILLSRVVKKIKNCKFR